MSYLGDTLTVGLILFLLFGSIALYLYTRIQQAEQKINLLESILLELKLTGELPSFSTLPAEDLSSFSSGASLSVLPVSSPSPNSSVSVSIPELVDESNQKKEEDDIPFLSETPEYTPFEEEVEEMNPLNEVLDSTSQSQSAPAPYENMSLKELQALVRSRGLSLEKGAKKQAHIDVLRKADETGSEVKPGSMSSSPFVETSSLVHDVME